MTRKWYATIKGQKNETIKIGIIKTDNGYDLIASNGDEVSISGIKTIDEAMQAIAALWGNGWELEWLDR